MGDETGREDTLYARARESEIDILQLGFPPPPHDG